MTARLFAFVIWAAVAASAVAWVLKLSAASRPVPPHAAVVGDSGVAGADLTRLLGADAPAAVAQVAPNPGSSRLKLLGVVAARAEAAAQSGVAVIAIDGRPGRPYRVGGPVDQDLVLLEVRQRSASLGPAAGPASIKLELPPLAAAATGTRPVAVNGALPPGPGSPLRPPPPMATPAVPPPMPDQQQIIDEPPMQPGTVDNTDVDTEPEVQTEVPPPQRAPGLGRRPLAN